MFAHLCEHTDFLEGRHFFEIESADVGVIERSARSSPDTHRMLDIAAGIESPPFELNCWTAWQGALVRAGAIAKFVYRTLLLGSRKDGPSPIELSNELLEMMGDENQQLADHPMMGFDRIWQRLADGVRADAKNVDLKAPLVTVKSMDQASETEPRAALEREAEAWFERNGPTIPDPTGTDLDICDLLAALDWRDYLERYLIGHNQNSIYENQAAFIDLRGVTIEEWTHHPGWTVARGIIYLRLPYPLLIRQLADQGVEDWPMIRDLDLPIFTQHSPDQLVPQSEVFFLLGGPWPAAYFNAITSTLTVHPYLHQACYLASQEGDDPVYMRADKGTAALSLPGGPSFNEWLRDYKNKK